MTTQTVSLDAHRETILGHLRAGRGYQFLTTVDGYLEAAADDAYVRLMAVREYLGLGLIPPAHDLLNDDAAGVESSAELLALREQVAALEGLPFSWGDFSPTFDANLTALSNRGVDVMLIRQTWSRSETEFQLFRDRHGVHQIRRRLNNRAWRWTPYLGNHRAVDDARPLPESIGKPMPGPFLFSGLGMGRFFERVYEATLDTFLGYSCALYIIEPDAAALSAFLHLHDWTTLLGDPRVFLFVGDNWRDQALAAWDADPDLPLPQEAITCPVVRNIPPPDAEGVVLEAAQRRERTGRASWDDLQRAYANKTIDDWAKRFDEALDKDGPPLRILAAVSCHTTFLQHSMRDAKRALEAVGHKCAVLTEPSDFAVTAPITFHKAIREYQPDLFLILDHIRPEFDGLIPDNLPILTWDQDLLPHVMTQTNLRKLARHDFVVGCSKVHCLKHGCDPKQILSARVPTCPEQFSGLDLTDEELARYTCDVSYVSHASQTPKQFHNQERAGYEDPRVVRLLDCMYEMVPDLLRTHRVMEGGVMCHVLAEGCRKVGISSIDADLEERLRSWYLWRLGDRLFRHEALEWVAAWARRTGRSFRIYGNGWDQHPTLRDFAAGPAQNGRELICIHRASRINLQLMPAGFIHQRSLDGLASGGFFLARLCPHDLRGKALRRLEERVRRLGIANVPDLLEHPDAELQELLRAAIGPWLRRMDHERYNLLHLIQANAELLSPDEAFEDFSSILFDSAEQFAGLAESFMSDEPRRQAVTDRMRRVVVENFSYQPTMSRFLREMASYLTSVATSKSDLR